MARIIVYGKTADACKKEVEKKKAIDWKPVTEVIEDKAYIGGRWVCVMERPNTAPKRRWNYL